MNWHFLLGFGLGLLLAACVLLTTGSRPVEPGEVERLARQQGMVYPQEVVPFVEDTASQE